MRFILLAILFASPFWAFSQIAPPDTVPVRLSTFDARRVGNGARLDWKVECFLPYAKFEIQHSLNGTNYTTINTFEADKVRCRQPFDFTEPNITGKIFYRIKVGDRDGKIYHSKIVSISAKVTGFEINSITPSFISAKAILSISSASEGNAEVRITNFHGLVVSKFPVRINFGVTDIPVITENLVRGNYIITVKNSFSEIKTTRFVKL